MLKQFEPPTRGTTEVAPTSGATVKDAPSKTAPSASPPTGKPTPGSSGRPILHALITLALFAWAFVGFDTARASVRFHGDESDWILTSRYFNELFLEADLKSSAWDEDYWTLTQPSGFRYVLGAGLWLQGRDPSTVSRKELDNRRQGREPAIDVLMDARRVTSVLGAVAVALLYVVAIQLAAPLAGVVAALLAGASPYLREHFVHAIPESTLSVLLLAGLALGLATFRRAPIGSLASALPIGLALGLALSAKLTAILSAPAVGVACLAAALATRLGGDDRRWWRPLAWGGIAALVGWGIFVALNPFLWPAPAQRTVAMLEHRQDELFRRQQNRIPREAVRDFRDRPGLVLGHTLINRTWSNTTLGVPLDVPLAVLGLATLVATLWQNWRGARRVGPAALFLLWLLSYLIGIVWGYGMNWDRYVAPLFLLAALLSGLGVQWLLCRALQAGRWGWNACQSPAPDACRV